MNILYVVTRPLEINSSASLRNINTVKGLLLLGHNVTVVSAKPSVDHPAYSKVDFGDLNPTQKYISSGIARDVSAKFSKRKVLNWIRVYLYKQRKKMNIYDSWTNISRNINYNEIIDEKYDVMISSSDPKSSHLIAEKIHDISGIRWIQIWGDPFSEDITSSGKLENKKKKEEKRFISKSSKACFLSPLTAEKMRQKYAKEKNKIYFMPRPYIEPTIINEREKQSDLVQLSYCGDYNRNVRNIIPLFDAANETGYMLTIVGNSDLQLRETSNVRIFPRQQKAFVDKVEKEADILVHLSNSSGNQIPGKIYNYSSTNKPILFILDGEIENTKKAFSKYNRYFFCINNKEDIIETLKAIVFSIGKRRFEPVQEFSYQIVLENMLANN